MLDLIEIYKHNFTEMLGETVHIDFMAKTNKKD